MSGPRDPFIDLENTSYLLQDIPRIDDNALIGLHKDFPMGKPPYNLGPNGLLRELGSMNPLQDRRFRLHLLDLALTSPPGAQRLSLVLMQGMPIAQSLWVNLVLW